VFHYYGKDLVNIIHRFQYVSDRNDRLLKRNGAKVF